MTGRHAEGLDGESVIPVPPLSSALKRNSRMNTATKPPAPGKNIAIPTATAPRSAAQAAIQNPAEEFDSPIDLADTDTLTKAQKERALEGWEADERALQRASDEGMTGGAPARLSEVKQAQNALDERADKAS